MKTVCLIGSSGSMGKSIQALLSGVYCFSYNRLSNATDSLVDDIRKSDVVIDFSNRDNLEILTKACVSVKAPLLCGTTGLSQEDFDLLKKAGEEIPVLYAANTSIGIAILKKAVALVAGNFCKMGIDGLDIAISETHHNLKKDAPSGTALALGNTIKESINDHKIDYSSIRGGNVVGKHAVHFFHNDEVINLSHECLNRNVFANGAIKAAQWLEGKPAGFYRFEDILEI